MNQRALVTPDAPHMSQSDRTSDTRAARPRCTPDGAMRVSRPIVTNVMPRLWGVRRHANLYNRGSGRAGRQRRLPNRGAQLVAQAVLMGRVAQSHQGRAKGKEEGVVCESGGCT